MAVTVLLFPLLYLTLELPKRIINDAISSESSRVVFYGIELDQILFLALLCGAFLVAVLVHGLLKMRINTRKGVLAERMLRRFRYQLISRMLRFPKPYFERTSQGELVSMVTAEAEPLGGMMGDALTQPVFQAGQMLTILAFLFFQSVWFGLAAVALIPIQAWIIPKLQRQINLLNKDRIKEVRSLATEIGETAAGASALRSNGGWRFRLAVITDRLGRLFVIRFQIYQKKFFMKFINNFITQLTPFFFFSIGGLLVIQGSVTLGALVAALAAFKDLSSPWKELLAYYNQAQDMSLRWEIITERFAPAGMIDEALFEGQPAEIPHLRGDIALENVTVRDSDGIAVLDNVNITFPKGGLVAIMSSSQEDRRVMAELIRRELAPSQGRVMVAGHDLAGLHQSVIAARIGHVDSAPYLFDGTSGDNVMMALKTNPHSGDDADPVSEDQKRKSEEAVYAGNSPDLVDVDWLNPALAGMETVENVHEWWLKMVEGMGSGEGLFRRGLDQTFDKSAHPELAARLVGLRAEIRQKIADADLETAVHAFDQDSYNPAVPVAENLLFGAPIRPVTQAELVKEPDFLRLLRGLKIESELLQLALDVVELLHQTFGKDGTDHPLFRRLGIDPKSFEKTVTVARKAWDSGIEKLDTQDRVLLLTVPFRLSAEQIGPLFTEEFKSRVLSLRTAEAAQLKDRLSGRYLPLDASEFTPGLTVVENAIFGKFSKVSHKKTEAARQLVAETLLHAGLKRYVAELSYDEPTGIGGVNLPARFAERLAFTRAAIKRPDVLVMDRALASYDSEVRIMASIKLREELPNTTLIYLEDRFENPANFDVYVELEDGQLRFGDAEAEESGERGASADLTEKIRAFEKTELFAGLNRQQLRLLAFGAQWFTAEAGEYVFRKDDDPSDGAYLVLEGEAGFYLPGVDAEERLIRTVGSGGLVGELALILHEPRTLDMRAKTDLKALRIGTEEFLAVVENDASVGFRLLQVISGYLAHGPDR
ncbi:MAG: cyclic nucleotide-binding domain-containing protein [Rhodobacteraceae bacterium]|nr:cyclic nucleotide-binding domain-containing protein [Paracoccaceae bacterium]